MHPALTVVLVVSAPIAMTALPFPFGAAVAAACIVVLLITEGQRELRIHALFVENRNLRDKKLADWKSLHP